MNVEDCGIGSIEVQEPVSYGKFHTYEEAISLIPVGGFHFWHMIVCGFCLMAVIGESMGVSFFMTAVICDLELSQTEQGILASSAFLGIVLSSYMWGLLADTWGRKRSLVVSSTCTIIFSIASAFSTSLWMLSVLRMLVGFFVSGCQVCTFAYQGEFHSEKTRARAVSLAALFLPLGFTYLPALAIGILPLNINYEPFDGMVFSSWRLYIILCSVPCLIASVGLRFLPESPKYLLLQGEHFRALLILRECFKRSEISEHRRYPVTHIIHTQADMKLGNVHNFDDSLRIVCAQTCPLFDRERIWKTFNIILLAFITYAIAHGMFIWAPYIINAALASRDRNDMTVCDSVYMQELKQKNFTKTHQFGHEKNKKHECSFVVNNFTYVCIIILGFISTALCLLVGFLIQKFGAKKLLGLWMTITGLAGLALYWSTKFYLGVFLIIIFLCLINAIGIIYAVAIDYYPANFSAMATCLILMAGRSGDVAGSYIVRNYLFTNCEILFCTCASLTIVCALLAIFLPDKPTD